MNCLPLRSGGAVAYVRNLAPLLWKEFKEGEAHSVVFLLHDEQVSDLQCVPAGSVVRIGGVRPTGYRRAVWERAHLGAIARGQRADVVFTPYQVAPPLPGLRQVLMLRNMEVFAFHSYRYSPRSLLRNALLLAGTRRCLRAADRVIAVSRFAHAHLTRRVGVPESKSVVIYHGSPELAAGDVHADVRLLENTGVRPPFVLTCGSLLPYRRCEDIVAAFDLCAARLGPDVRLVIAGSGSDTRYVEGIRRQVRASPNRERIALLGEVPWHTMAALYRRCAVFVTATEVEACPNIALEAMSAGAVIVSADCEPLPEMFAGCSIEFPARDVGALARSIDRAFSDGCTRQGLSFQARKRAKEFSWQKCAFETYQALTTW